MKPCKNVAPPRQEGAPSHVAGPSFLALSSRLMDVMSQLTVKVDHVFFTFVYRAFRTADGT